MDKLDLKKLIADSDFVDNTANIRELQHSNLIKKDIELMLKLKTKHVRLVRNDFEKFTKMCMSQCSFLFNGYTDIFNRVLKDELDLNVMGSVLDVLCKIENGEVNQMDGSVEVGQLLKKLYVDSALKKAHKIDAEHPENNEDHVFQESKILSWRDYKTMNS